MACFGDGFKPLKETEESVKPQLELAGRSARQGVIKAAPISWPAGPQLADRAAIKARRRRNLSELPAGVLASPSALAGDIIVEAPALDVESGASSHWPQAKPERRSTGARLSDQPLPAVAEEQEGAAADEVDACDDALSMASVCISLGRSLAAEVVYSADLMPEEDSMLFADEALACFSLTHTEENSELEEGEIPAAAAAAPFVADNICAATAFTAPEPALSLGSATSPVSITPAAIDDAALTTIIASDAEHSTLEAAEAAAPTSVPDSQATIDEATLQAIFDDLERSLVEDARSPPPPAAPMPLGAEDSLASSTTDISEAALQAIFDDLERSLLEDALSPQPPAAPLSLGAEDSLASSTTDISEAALQAIFDDLERSLVEDARSPPPPAAPMPLGAEDSLASSTTDISEAALQAIFDDLERSLLEDALSPQPPAAPLSLGAEDSLASSTTDISEAALQAIFDDLERSLTESAAATEQPEEVSDEALQAIFDELDRALTESAAAAEQPEEWSDEAADALFDELDRAFPLPAAVDDDTECGPAALPASDPAADSDSDSDDDSSTASEISDEAMAAFFGKLDRSPRTYDLSPLACPADEVPACDELAAPGTPEASWSSGSDVLVSLRMTLGEYEAASGAADCALEDGPSDGPSELAPAVQETAIAAPASPAGAASGLELAAAVPESPMVEPCLGNGLVAPAGSGIDDAAWAQLMEDLSSSLSDDDCIVGESLLLPEYEGESRNMELVHGALPDEESSDEEAGDSYASSLADIFEDSESTIEELLTEFESSISDVFGDPEASDDELLIPAEGGLPDLFYGALPSVHMTLGEASSICGEDMHKDDGAAEGAGSTGDQALAPVAGDNCATSEEAEREARLDRLTERLNALLSSITYLEDRAGPRQ